MKNKFSLINLCALLFFCVIFNVNAGNQKLVDVHKKAGVNCVNCHDALPPKSPPSQDKCVTCHGNNDKRKEIKLHEGEDRNLLMNIHKPHVGELRCGVCHSVHQESKLYCNEACHHRFDVKVP
ncbi:hypothetical protein E2650_05915 [Shewanella xiamenensis]|uniref:Cytochrome c3 family protein n=2 Tax=Shewanella TaxID=22 RepID=A0A5B8R2D8_9GAMM|nr:MULTISPECIES: cytochrome c3 family protein [Shewanella]MDG5899447.1 hypothetical protein [Shewanella xiamenensis]QDZ92326.1 cytochrome c3 family protein [Shewanella decolorationis]